MPRYDMILITTIEAESFKTAENWLVDFADDLADTHHMPFTAIGHVREHNNNGQRVIYLHPENEESEYTGPIEMEPDA